MLKGRTTLKLALAAVTLGAVLWSVRRHQQDHPVGFAPQRTLFAGTFQDVDTLVQESMDENNDNSLVVWAVAVIVVGVCVVVMAVAGVVIFVFRKKQQSSTHTFKSNESKSV